MRLFGADMVFALMLKAATKTALSLLLLYNCYIYFALLKLQNDHRRYQH
jgi:hypothetical protein